MDERLPGNTGGGPDALAAGSRVAGYLLEEEIGAGGMALVFRARDERLGRLVALKLLTPGLAADEEFRRRFLRECRAAAAVDDPHIIPVYEAGEADGVLFIAMRLVSGGDVRGLLRREGPLPPGRVAAIVSPVASALDAAHGAGLVHRDVKPGNMLIDARPGRPDHVYVSDFGLAKSGAASALTGTGLMLGTAAYMAPEQIQGGEVDGRADQYALGCAAFELLCGGVPFERDQDVAVIYAHLSAPPPSAADRCPGLPPGVDGVLGRALAKVPEDRYPGCREFAEALRGALGLPAYGNDPGSVRAGAAAGAGGATVVRPAAGDGLASRHGSGRGALATGLPQGTVTFLFTDLEGSTRRWEEHPAQMRDALARHNTIVRGAVDSHGGVVFSTMGDGMAAVFASAREAVRAVLAAQAGLAAEDWGEVTGPLAARMGLLTDEGVLGGEHYLNQPLNRCARLMAAGHGGQALVSGATELLVRDDLPDGCTLVDLGEYRLRDLARPVRIFQLTGPGLRAEFPPLRTLEAFAGNLPVQLTSFLGREQDLAGLERLLGEARLVTLTGTGGTGKTRLALEAGTRVAGWFPDGVWLAELAGIADPGLVAAQVMGALGVRQAGDVPVLEALIYRLRSAELLLILDNCEHLLDACAGLARALLRAAPGLRVLATSREPLGIPGEVTFPVRPLDLPPETAEAREAGEAAAVRLFLDRGSAARGGTAGEVAPVAVAERICRKLDGLPLAIELAAARLGTLSAAEIEAHLADRFRFLAYRRPGADPRHQALRATMDWSYDLLSAAECQVLGELSVFAGTFGLAQAAEVCGGGDQLTAWEVIDRLAGKSLVAAEPAEDGTRYRLLDTVRHYAADRLAEAGGTEAARHRHAAAFLALAERERRPGGAGARAGQLPRSAGMVPRAWRPDRAAARPGARGLLARPRAAAGGTGLAGPRDGPAPGRSAAAGGPGAAARRGAV